MAQFETFGSEIGTLRRLADIVSLTICKPLLPGNQEPSMDYFSALCVEDEINKLANMTALFL